MAVVVIFVLVQVKFVVEQAAFAMQVVDILFVLVVANHRHFTRIITIIAAAAAIFVLLQVKFVLGRLVFAIQLVDILYVAEFVALLHFTLITIQVVVRAIMPA